VNVARHWFNAATCMVTTRRSSSRGRGRSARRSSTFYVGLCRLQSLLLLTSVRTYDRMWYVGKSQDDVYDGVVGHRKLSIRHRACVAAVQWVHVFQKPVGKTLTYNTPKLLLKLTAVRSVGIWIPKYHGRTMVIPWSYQCILESKKYHIAKFSLNSLLQSYIDICVI